MSQSGVWFYINSLSSSGQHAYLAVWPDGDGGPELLADLVTRLDHLELKDDHHLLGVGGVANVLLYPDDGVLLQLVLLDDSLVTVYMTAEWQLTLMRLLSWVASMAKLLEYLPSLSRRRYLEHKTFNIVSWTKSHLSCPPPTMGLWPRTWRTGLDTSWPWHIRDNAPEVRFIL